VYVLELAGQDDDFAVYEARTAADGVERLAPGLATARGLSDRVAGLAFTHRVSDLVGTTDADVASAEALLSAASIDREGTVAVRAVDVRGSTGIDTQAVERALGAVLTDRGFEVDLDAPDQELRALFAARDDAVCALGWLTSRARQGLGARAPTDRPFFQPGSMAPELARALANLAGARPGATLLDPMCGTGGIPIEAGLVGARTLAADVQPKMAAGTRTNLADALGNGGVAGLQVEPGAWDVIRADARSLPVTDGAVDGVVFDAPYGRQSKITGDLTTLVQGALREAARVADRCVVVGDRPWARVANAVGWTTEAAFHRQVHRSLTRHVLVLA
jgi:tRNA (guanine10-N2)-dimethyltransferase